MTWLRAHWTATAVDVVVFLIGICIGTVTVQLAPQDGMISGSFQYQFQVDTEF